MIFDRLALVTESTEIAFIFLMIVLDRLKKLVKKLVLGLFSLGKFKYIFGLSIT